MALQLLTGGKKSAGGPSGLHDSPDEKKAELTEHLAELRTRLIRAALYLVVGGIIAYAFFPPLFGALSKPIVTAMHEVAQKLPPDQRVLAGRFVFHGFAEPFLLRLQISLYAGVVIALPLIVLEIWGFVAPGLTSNERRPMQFIAPFSVLLFGLGAGLAFFIMPQAVHWFLSYLPDFPNAILLQDPADYILFVVKMMLVFGIVFQLPIIMMGLGKLGILRSAFLVKYWRYAVVIITVLAMVVTPSNDPFSMIVMAVPLVILFFLSIFLVKLVEPRETLESR